MTHICFEFFSVWTVYNAPWVPELHSWFPRVNYSLSVKKETTKENKPPTIPCNVQIFLFLSFGEQQASPSATLCPYCLGCAGVGRARLAVDVTQSCVLFPNTKQTNSWYMDQLEMGDSRKQKNSPSLVETECHVIAQSLPPHGSLLLRASLRNVFWKIGDVDCLL